MKDKNTIPTLKEIQTLAYESQRKIFDLGVHLLREAETLPSTPQIKIETIKDDLGRIIQTTKTTTANREKTIKDGKKCIRDALKRLRKELGLGKFKALKTDTDKELNYLDLAFLDMKEIETKAIEKGIITTSQKIAAS